MAQDPSKPLISKLHELKVSHAPVDLFALLVEKTRGSKRDGKPYFQCKFRDSRRTVSSIVWADHDHYIACEKEWMVGRIYKLRAVYTEHDRYGPQLELLRVRETTTLDRDDGLVETDFFERSRIAPEDLYKELILFTEKELKNPALRQLTLGLLTQHSETLMQLPASVNRYHTYPGGWLEHTLHVAQNCAWLSDQYLSRQPDLKLFNRDLVIAGALLHEIGRVAEMTNVMPGRLPDITIPGKLFGHIHLARDLVREAAKNQPDIHPELILLLEHIILAHLERPEWGSPRLPVIPEVLILHHADDLDAKFEMYARHLNRDSSDGPFTERDPVLGKQLLKQREILRDSANQPER